MLGVLRGDKKLILEADGGLMERKSFGKLWLNQTPEQREMYSRIWTSPLAIINDTRN